MAHPLETTIERAKRTANSQTILSYVAAAFLLLFGYFWYLVWAQFLSPPSLTSPQAVIAVVLTLCYTVVWPLFGSMMIPNSPARAFLQKQTWAVPGSIAVVGITGFLAYFASKVFYYWVAAQPGIQENPDLFWPAVIGTFVGAFFVPVLCWATATPEQIIAQIQQALWIKDMERAAKLRERVWRAADVRAQAIIHAGMVSGVLSLDQRRELAGLMLASHRTLQQGLRMVALTMDEAAHIEDLLPSTPDTELIQLYREVPIMLNSADEELGGALAQIDARAAVLPARSDPSERPKPQPQLYTKSHQADTIPHDATSYRETVAYENEYAIAVRELRGAWTVRELAGVLSLAEPTARQRKEAWEQAGLVSGRGLSNGRYQFT
jgi:hypothetical protein